MQTSIVLLFTPGLDSFVANNHLTDIYQGNDEVIFNRVYFDLQHAYADAEIELLKEWYKNDKYFTLSQILNMKALEQPGAYIPNRNLLLLSLAQSLFNADVIYLNGVLDDRVSDNVREFRELASQVLTQSAGKPVIIRTIFEGIEKAKAVEQFAEVHPTRKLELLTNTFSCFSDIFYEEEDLTYFNHVSGNEYVEAGKTTVYGCMECSACFRKMCALTSANIYVPFFDFSIVKKYKEESAVNELIHPNRAKSVEKYHNFLNWFGCD